jgi:hypothetical protein
LTCNDNIGSFAPRDTNAAFLAVLNCAVQRSYDLRGIINLYELASTNN